MKVSLNNYKISELLTNDNQIPFGVRMVGAENIWEEANYGEGIIVAVIDTGVDTTHPNLQDNIIGGYNFTREDDVHTFEDYNGHGTHVAGIIAAINYQKGMVGMAPKSKLLILKALDVFGNSSYSILIKALKFAMNWRGPNKEKVSIINMSIGGNRHSEELYSTIKELDKQGIILVSAAGNNGDSLVTTEERSFPSFYHEVISVGSISEKYIPSTFSDTNLNIDFVALGENVYSTHLNAGYAELTGTSMAAPFVSGAIALILNTLTIYEQELAPLQVKKYLINNAIQLPYSVNAVGNGVVHLS